MENRTEPEATPTPFDDTINAREAASSLGELLSRVGFGRERILITRHGKPIAALVPVTEATPPATSEAA